MKIALGKRESLQVHMTCIVGRLEIFLILFKSLCNMHCKFAIHHAMSFCHMVLTEHKCAGIQVMCLLVKVGILPRSLDILWVETWGYGQGGRVEKTFV